MTEAKRLLRILTTGRRASIEDGADTVKTMIEKAAGRIEILPGGMSPSSAPRLRTGRRAIAA